MTSELPNSGSPADDMAEYLQTFLDETEEQLDDLVLGVDLVGTACEVLGVLSFEEPGGGPPGRLEGGVS